MIIGENSFEIRRVAQYEFEVVLGVYRHCEDFLALGPVTTASMEMVLKDNEISQSEGGVYCGIYTADGKMVGIVDYIPNNYGGDPHIAFLSLLMIDVSFRKKGVGKAVVEAIEDEIKKDTQVTIILSGVQVNNPQAVKFWQRNGYRIVGEPKKLLDQTIVFDLRKDINKQD